MDVLFSGAVNDILGWRAWIPLSRVTFCAYLIHPILLQIYYLSRPHAFHFTTVYQMVCLLITYIFLFSKKVLSLHWYFIIKKIYIAKFHLQKIESY